MHRFMSPSGGAGNVRVLSNPTVSTGTPTPQPQVYSVPVTAQNGGGYGHADADDYHQSSRYRVIFG